MRKSFAVFLASSLVGIPPLARIPLPVVESFSPAVLPSNLRHVVVSVPERGRFSSRSCLSSSTRLSSAVPTPTEEDDANKTNASLRGRLRQLTGFSFTALRTTLRAATGISFSAVYVSSVAITGAWIRQTMTVFLSVFPTWMRYFVQPFLVAYYAPLFILRNLTGPTRKKAKQTHEHIVEGWKHAVEVADEKAAYWPLHVRDGEFVTDYQELDVNEAVAESVEISLDEAAKE